MGEPGQGGAAGILQGVRVVEAGGRLAAPVLGVLLAEQGAEVLRVVPPEPPADPVLQAILSRGKTEVPLDLATAAGREALGRLLAGADLALTDLGPAARAAAGLDFEGARARNPGLITCAIPAFPGGDPRADEDVPDAVAGAAGCLYERMLGAPRFHELPVPSVLAALFAGSGVAAALRARLRDGRGQHVEASLRGSSLFAQILLLFMKLGVPRGFVPLKLVATPFMRSWRCRDGRWAYLHITLPSHNAKMLEVLEAAGLGHHAKALRAVLSEETRRDPSQVGSIGEAKRIVRVLTTIFRERTADEWEATLGRELCCIKVRTVEEWLRDSDAAGMSDAAAVEDPVLGTLVTPGPGISCPEQPPVSSPRRIAADLPSLLARWAVPAAPRSALPPPGAPEDRRPPLAGVRVADLSRIIAGPCGARVLAELGAEVTSFQSPGALDWALSFHLMFNAG
ncbi:MAG: CoA transferase, partial [Deltaproteobacteria bacterium]|nr:CoA transferase [Deltaproteobacteria bacterium]